MEEPAVVSSLLKEDLFRLFKEQMKKDFEGSGNNADFADSLPQQYDNLKSALVKQITALSTNRSSSLHAFLYRIDISE